MNAGTIWTGNWSFVPNYPDRVILLSHMPMGAQMIMMLFLCPPTGSLQLGMENCTGWVNVSEEQITVN
jgi:hypothetical protein